MLESAAVRAVFLLLIAVFFSGCAHQDVASLYVDAVTLRENGQLGEAVEKLNLVVKAEPRFSPAHSLLGEIYRDAGQYEKSAASYEEATKINRWSFGDFFNLGRVYQIMERFADAVEAYVVACRLKPKHFEAHFNTAKCYYELEAYEEALEYGRAAEEIDPNVGALEKFLGDVYETTSDYEQAIVSYRKALEFSGGAGSDPNIMMPLALAYVRSKRYEPAVEVLEQVVEGEPGNGLAYYYLGYAYLKLKDNYSEPAEQLLQVDKAIESYRTATEINDSDWMAHKGLGVTYMIKFLATKDEELKVKAIEHWKRSLQIQPDQSNSQKLRRLIDVYSR